MSLDNVAGSGQLMNRSVSSYARVTERRVRRRHPGESVPRIPQRKEEFQLKLFVGIDVSSEELEACFMNPEGDTLRR